MTELSQDVFDFAEEFVKETTVLNHPTQGISDPHLILAGGAVRDLMFDREISDYDIFVKCNQNLAGEEGAVSYGKAYKYLRKNKWHKKASTAYPSGGVQKSFKFKYKDSEINLVLIDEDPEEYIPKYFDIGLCECWINLKSMDMKTTPAFDTDAADKTLTVQFKKKQNEYGIGRCINYHVPKIQKKYPNHKIVFKYNGELYKEERDPDEWETWEPPEDKPTEEEIQNRARELYLAQEEAKHQQAMQQQQLVTQQQTAQQQMNQAASARAQQLAVDNSTAAGMLAQQQAAGNEMARQMAAAPKSFGGAWAQQAFGQDIDTAAKRSLFKQMTQDLGISSEDAKSYIKGGGDL